MNAMTPDDMQGGNTGGWRCNGIIGRREARLMPLGAAVCRVRGHRPTSPHGFQWQRSQVCLPDHVDRLLLVIAIAYWLVMAVGQLLSAPLTGCASRWSCFRSGWEACRVVFRPTIAVLLPPPDPLPDLLHLSCSEPSGRGELIPNILWCPVPAGTFLYGEKKELRSLNYDYQISAYPVTNAQFQPFIDDAQGYYNNEWWKKPHWAGCQLIAPATPRP